MRPLKFRWLMQVPSISCFWTKFCFDGIGMCLLVRFRGIGNWERKCRLLAVLDLWR
ncbi:hypothetical protein LINPERPRIM_LOCUS18026 [Linum perenne]